ncbi:MAG: hypothetical protein V7K25_10085 [Nostoc sp.]|uniref:hypothetical protein n=1 Tax=Nostoc sp. TaxID=1180 RepID=UPI002FF9D56A
MLEKPLLQIWRVLPDVKMQAVWEIAKKRSLPELAYWAQVSPNSWRHYVLKSTQHKFAFEEVKNHAFTHSIILNPINNLGLLYPSFNF